MNPQSGSTDEKQKAGPNAADSAADAHAYRSLVSFREFPGKGRGVFVTEDVGAEVEVERAPVILVPAKDLLDPQNRLTVIDQYLLYWSDEPDKELAMGCGLLMLYNHSKDANVELREGPLPLTMSVFSTRPLKAGEELVYDYDVELWFTEAR